MNTCHFTTNLLAKRSITLMILACLKNQLYLVVPKLKEKEVETKINNLHSFRNRITKTTGRGRTQRRDTTLFTILPKMNLEADYINLNLTTI